MVSLARASLIYEWRRYLAAMLAVTFAGLLVLVQLALLLGQFGTVSVIVDKSRADLWIGYRNTQSVDLGRPVPRFSDIAAWMHPQIEQIERYYLAYGDLRRKDGVAAMAVINVIEAHPGALALADALTAEQRALLEEPGTMLLDVADQDKLEAEVGDDLEVNGKRVRVAGFVEGMRAIGGVNLLLSFDTARTVAPEAAEAPTYYLLSLRPGADPAQVVADLEDRAHTPRYSVWQAIDLSVQSQMYWLLESGAGIGAGFASLLALMVGIAITHQTLSGAILASMKEFAALRALGVSLASLRRVVLEQSFWIGTIGLLATGVVTVLMAWLGYEFRIAMAFPWWMLAGVALLILLIALLSGVLALRPLLQAEPALLLR